MRSFPTTEEHYLAPERRRTVEVVFEAILPGTDTKPGATDAAAAEFLDRLLAIDPSVFYEVAGWRTQYDQGIDALNAAAQQQHGRAPGDLEPAEAAALVGALAEGSIAPWPEGIDQKRLFATLRGHCIEGCFADPRWGGNRDEVVWRWIGYGRRPSEFRRGENGELEEVASAQS